MKTTKRQRTARKLILPAIAVVLMTTMMYVDSTSSPQHDVSRELYQR